MPAPLASRTIALSGFRRFCSLWLPALVLLTALGGCGVASAPGTSWSIAGPEWRVIEIDGEEVATEIRPTLQLQSGGTQVSGSGGVNRFVGSYRLAGTSLSFGPMAVTHMAGPPEQMKAEAGFFQMLAKVTSHRVVDRGLVLLAGDKIVARAQAAPAVPAKAP